MSSDEEALAIGRLISEHKTVERQCALLQNELDNISRECEGLALLLKAGYNREQLAGVDWSLLDRDKILVLVDDLTKNSERLKILQERKEAAGI